MAGRSVEVLLHHMCGCASSQNVWEASFAKSILRQSKRKNWQPSPAQEAVMHRIVRGLFEDPECVVLEDDE